ncbi:hypothetical protein ACH4TY_29375 [Streptomyces anulatus]
MSILIRLTCPSTTPEFRGREPGDDGVAVTLDAALVPAVIQVVGLERVLPELAAAADPALAHLHGLERALAALAAPLQGRGGRTPTAAPEPA